MQHKIKINTVSAFLKDGLKAKDGGFFSEAVSNFMKALQLDLSFVPALIELAILYDDVKNLEKSIIYYQRALKLDPNHYELRLHYANVLIRNESVDQGIQEIRIAIEQNEEKVDGWYYLAIAYFFYLNETEKALAIANQINKMDPAYTSGYTLLGEIYFSLGDTDKSIKYFQKALRLDPENKDAHLALSAIFGNDLKDREKSLKHSMYLLNKYPQDKLAKNNAIMALKLPLNKSTPLSEQVLTEGMAYLYLEKWDQAEHALKRAMHLKPSHPEVWKILQKVRCQKIPAAH